MNTQRENISEMKEAKRIEKRHLMNCRIAGFSYWDGAEAFEKLKIGTPLDLVREPDNRFDPYAVAIYYGWVSIFCTDTNKRYDRGITILIKCVFDIIVNAD